MKNLGVPLTECEGHKPQPPGLAANALASEPSDDRARTEIVQDFGLAKILRVLSSQLVYGG